MLKLEPIELILRAIPEGFLYMLGVYIFSNTKIIKFKYIISSIIVGFIMFFIRELPISYGVHTILLILFIIFFNIFYSKIDSVVVVKSTVIIFVFQLLSELINVSLLNLFKLNIDLLFKDAIIKNILGIPSLVITLVFILGYKRIKNRGGNELYKKDIK